MHDAQFWRRKSRCSSLDLTLIRRAGNGLIAGIFGMMHNRAVLEWYCREVHTAVALMSPESDVRHPAGAQGRRCIQKEIDRPNGSKSRTIHGSTQAAGQRARRIQKGSGVHIQAHSPSRSWVTASLWLSFPGQKIPAWGEYQNQAGRGGAINLLSGARRPRRLRNCHRSGTGSSWRGRSPSRSSHSEDTTSSRQ